MKRIISLITLSVLLITIFTLHLSLTTVHAAADIALMVPGPTGRMVAVDFTVPEGHEWNGDNIYLAHFFAVPPVKSQIYATFRVMTVPEEPGRLMFDINRTQAAALAGKTGRWALVEQPPLGNPRTLAHGKMEVTR